MMRSSPPFARAASSAIFAIRYPRGRAPPLGGNDGVVGAECLLVDVERALVQGFGARELTLPLVQHRQAGDRVGHEGVVGAQRFFLDAKGSLSQRLGAR